MADMGSDEITSDDKLWVLLTYIFAPIVPIIILLMEGKKNRAFIRAHNAQALVWGIISIVVGTITLGCGGLIMWAIGVFWGIKGYQGELVTIPVITDFVKNQGWA